MHEHEVPTHVQAEDKVLLWFTFPQLIALAAVAALSYGLYHYLPIGSGTIRLLLGIGFAATGIMMVAGKVGGRPLPAVLADLIKFGLGGRRFTGPALMLVRSEPPAPPVQEQRSKRPRTRGERMPRVPLGWFRKRDRKQQSKRDFDEAKQSIRRESAGHRLRCPALFGATGLVVALSITVCTPPLTVAQEPSNQPQLPEEIEFELEPVVEGRRLYVERLTVTASEATVVLKAVTHLDLNIQVFGGADGRKLVGNQTVELDERESTTAQLPLDGPSPSFTFAWLDEFEQTGAVALAGSQLPHPLPSVKGELCDLRVTKVEWRPGKLSGVVESYCVASLNEQVTLQTVSGHQNLSQDVNLPAQVTSINGTLIVQAKGHQASTSFVSNGETRFEITLGAMDAETLDVSIETALTADVQIALPPLIQLTHVPQRTETFSETISVSVPDSEETVSETVTFQVVHPARIEAKIVQRAPLSKQRTETLALTTSIAADAPFEALARPVETTPAPTQTRVTGSELTDLMALLGWELD